MSVSLQFTCPTKNEATRKAMESYVGYLERVFEQYWNLWKDYANLKEEHKQCNVHSSLQITTDKSYIVKKENLTSQKQSNDCPLVQENNSVSLLELDTLHTTCNTYELEMKNSTNLGENIKSNSPSKSPVLSSIFTNTFMRIGNPTKKFTQSKVSVRSNSSPNIKTHYNVEKVPTQYNKKLKISTAHHVETTFLPDGKKLKQSRLVFHPVKHEQEKISSDLDKLKLVNKNQDKGQFLTDASLKKTSVTIENNAITDATFCEDDVIEISPTQRNICLKNRLKLKRKDLIMTKCSTNKNKNQIPESDFTTEMTTENTNQFGLSPKNTYAEATCSKSSLIRSDVINTLKDNVNRNNYTPAQKHTKPNIEITTHIDNQKKESTSNFDEETFYLPVEQTKNKNEIDYFNPCDMENKPPVKRMLLDSFNEVSRKKDISEQLNMRCRADRAKLNGADCWECEEYYKNLPVSKEDLQKRMNQCSRHRQKYKRPTTPEGFWDPEFPETSSFTSLNKD